MNANFKGMLNYFKNKNMNNMILTKKQLWKLR
jgi:hypothetical protein